MRPSEVRHRILAEHAELRAELHALDALARQLLEGDSASARALLERGEALQERFLAHLALEDRSLIPALREADAWGPERAAEVDREHRAQRREVDALLRDLREGSAPPAELARRLRAWVDAVLTDMEHEDRAVLTRDVLHDDPTLGDAEGG